ncbi:Gfo/Idh/MocA family oxidoreductase [bacterium]|nr:Gfo/Idh/MocA family oxidoreductase [bacterium]
MKPVDVLMVGSGEYTTGFVNDESSKSDKRAGVVALTMFDLRRRGLVGELKMAGTNGTRFPGIRRHFQAVIGDRYKDLDLSFESFPADNCQGDRTAYMTALKTMSAGDVVVVFTPDDTHYEITMAAVRHGCHVLVAKPLVKTVADHVQLQAAAFQKRVLVAMEVHKRWDPIYADARDRIRELGDFSYFQSYMSQPKSQLQTFKSWAGKSSDISYYLNAHHVDFNVWAVGDFAWPVSVFASASIGCAQNLGFPTEDSITLTVQWQNESGSTATGLYTSSWIAPKSDVHSQQRFFYMGHAGEVTVDQAHRGYSVATDAGGFQSANPLFMKYKPAPDGSFVGQSSYGYRSFDAFIRAVRRIADGASHADFDSELATVNSTLPVTAILEAGRVSLDRGQLVTLKYDGGRIVGIE